MMMETKRFQIGAEIKIPKAGFQNGAWITNRCRTANNFMKNAHTFF